MSKVQGQAFTCGNSRFATDTSKSRFLVVNDGNYSLWVEHVSEYGAPSQLYWLMWYDKAGNPALVESAIFASKDFAIIRRLTI
jgi:hypothetical protein